eukprot:SAG31_NODE_12264_length_954_cov_1.200000_1_plen_151_part_10
MTDDGGDHPPADLIDCAITVSVCPALLQRALDQEWYRHSLHRVHEDCAEGEADLGFAPSTAYEFDSANDSSFGGEDHDRHSTNARSPPVAGGSSLNIRPQSAPGLRSSSHGYVDFAGVWRPYSHPDDISTSPASFFTVGSPGKDRDVDVSR